jgi:hypothetical protein
MRTGRPKQPLLLTEEERERLESLAPRARSQALLARRAQVCTGVRGGTRQSDGGAQAAVLAGHGGQVARTVSKGPLGSPV